MTLTPYLCLIDTVWVNCCFDDRVPDAKKLVNILTARVVLRERGVSSTGFRLHLGPWYGYLCCLIGLACCLYFRPPIRQLCRHPYPTYSNTDVPFSPSSAYALCGVRNELVSSMSSVITQGRGWVREIWKGRGLMIIHRTNFVFQVWRSI